MPAHQPSTVIHIDKLTIQLSNALYDAEAYAARHNHGSRSKVIVRDIKQGMRALTGPLESDAEQQQHQQPTSLQPPVNNESRLSNRFPSLIGSRAQQEVPLSPSPAPPRQPTPMVPEVLSGIF